MTPFSDISSGVDLSSLSLEEVKSLRAQALSGVVQILQRLHSALEISMDIITQGSRHQPGPVVKRPGILNTFLPGPAFSPSATLERQYFIEVAGVHAETELAVLNKRLYERIRLASDLQDRERSLLRSLTTDSSDV